MGRRHSWHDIEKQWSCIRCKTEHRGKFIVTVHKRDEVGCAYCVKPDPEILQRAHDHLYRMAAQKLAERGVDARTVPADWFYAYTMKLLGLSEDFETLAARYREKYPDDDNTSDKRNDLSDTLSDSPGDSGGGPPPRSTGRTKTSNKNRGKTRKGGET